MDTRIVARTNNPLERFNRKMNAAIDATHPSLPAFISVVDSLSQRYVQLLSDITNRRAAVPRREPLKLSVPCMQSAGDYRGTIDWQRNEAASNPESVNCRWTSTYCTIQCTGTRATIYKQTA
ncbi:hypothetical protein PHMEG_00021078 [Phytophthora megakarya]|uniref:Uncharacterized protein n=1 Tax=Phytophthora megakarya TaxID=4795 RepID=A0A225VM66_9STRA|nr:hypothetical protein PHMEG_00021078 [Phytophthora megakarya]